jgi:hypothetical protein
MNLTPEVVDFYRRDILRAVAEDVDIIVYTHSGGPAYVRHVEGAMRPRSIKIGPVSITEMEALRDFIRSCITNESRTSAFLTPEEVIRRVQGNRAGKSISRTQ